MLWIVATPIGNRADLSTRALETLQQSDVIFCEDTRHSGPFLRELGIQAPLLSLHEHNEAQRVQQVMDRLARGETVSLISDAGLPGVCDPGQRVIRAAREQGWPLSVIPGPCAFITAWAALGWEPPFQFLGFLPAKGPQRQETLALLAVYPGATLFYEAPHRLADTLQQIASLLPSRRVAIARELTKKFEEVREAPAPDLALWAAAHPPRGEFVVAISPPTQSELKFLNLPFKEQVQQIEQMFQIDKMQAIKLVAGFNNVAKSIVYKSSLD